MAEERAAETVFIRPSTARSSAEQTTNARSRPARTNNYRLIIGRRGRMVDVKYGPDRKSWGTGAIKEE